MAEYISNFCLGGPYGVAIFFLISGFTIPFSLRRVSRSGFIINRLLRIIPTYIAGFSITLIALLVGSKYFLQEWPYTTKEILIHYIPGLRDITGSRNIDFVVWTLEAEIKFYLLCAIFITWFKHYSIRLIFIPIALFILMMILHLTNNLTQGIFNFQYIIFMFIGVVFHYLYSKEITVNQAWIFIGIIFALFCISWYIGPQSAIFGVISNYAYALLTFTFAYTYPSIFKSNIVFDFFANISYPLYVIHGVAGYIALRILLDSGVKNWAALLIVTSTCFLFAWILHKLIEQPSQAISKRLLKK